MKDFDKALQALVNAAHAARIDGNVRELVKLMDRIDTTIHAMQNVRRQIRKEFPCLTSYDSNGNYIGPVANENGWTP
jgi:hypothetical protein